MMSIWVASTGLPFGLRSPLFGCFIFIPLTSLIFILSLHSKTSLIILEKVPQCCRLMAIAFFVRVLILSNTKKELYDAALAAIKLLLFLIQPVHALEQDINLLHVQAHACWLQMQPAGQPLRSDL
jgi:hypothetical protein